MKISHLLFCTAILSTMLACKKEESTSEPKLIFKYTFDENGERQDNFGESASIPAGNAAQTPEFSSLGVHSIELINYVVSLPTTSTVIYKGAEKTAGGQTGIDFDLEKLVSEGDVLVEIPIKNITPGTYTYLRNSLGYQNYKIDFLYNDPNFGAFNLQGDIASFVGYRTFISDFTVGGTTINVDSIVSQGFWAFHIEDPLPYTHVGQAASTTVPNPLDAVSPIPLGSCLVTGAFVSPLVITGNETEDIVVEVAISINNSFEWVDVVNDGKYEPLAGETVVDMGTRGLKAIIK
ncbi:MAG: hypothetical protein H6579_03480 [Chitinophagales bacterium]|nr:hypothetical protein [Chitinophagales bacterium]